MFVLIIFLILALLIVASVRPRRSDLSEFELGRRCEEQDEAALLDWRREELLADVGTWRRLTEMFLMVVVIVALTVEYGALVGASIGLSLVLVYPVTASLSAIRAFPQRLYDRYELKILDFAESTGGFTKLFRRHVSTTKTSYKAASRPELQHVITESADVLKPDERKLFVGAFDFADKLVKDYMTPRSMMEAIGAHEMLGPLVLDDLHKTGHSHFPVLDGDIDHIVGTLQINNLLLLSQKKSQTVQDVMDPQVFYIHENQTLSEVLSACIKKRRHLLVVINDFRETMGVITIEDAIEQLIGQKIIGQFDQYDDIRAVAAKNPRQNNQSPATKDV